MLMLMKITVIIMITTMTHKGNGWSCFDIQLCNFEENVCPSRLTDWEFDKTASAGKIVTKTHSDTSVLFQYYGQRLL